MNLVKHLLSRNYDPSRYQTTWFDHDENIVVFPVYDLSGRLVGYQQYRPNVTAKRLNHPKDARYFTYLPREVFGCWGYQTAQHSPFVFVQEGVFDASPLHMLNMPAVTLLGATNRHVLHNLKLQGKKTLCLADNDKAGLALAAACDYSLVLPTDVGELSLEEVFSYASTLLDRSNCRK